MSEAQETDAATVEDRALALTPSAAEATVRRLAAVAAAVAECPCCGRSDACEDGCVYAEDCGGPQTQGPLRMAEARAAIAALGGGGA